MKIDIFCSQNLNLSKGNEGKVGTVVLKNEPGQVVTEKDLEKIVQICKENLQPAACPRIYRVQVKISFFRIQFFFRKRLPLRFKKAEVRAVVAHNRLTELRVIIE